MTFTVLTKGGNGVEPLPTLARFNMALGFAVIALAAAAGAFVATDINDGFLRDPAALNSWSAWLARAAHGHANLFGLLHVAFGLTMPYSAWSSRIKALQTGGLAAGSLAMGVGLVVKGQIGPVIGIGVTDVLVGGCLAMALVALAAHAAGLAVGRSPRG